MKKNNVKYSGLEIAVVGMACKFPGANNVNEFWDFLKSGKNSYSKFTPEELEASGVPETLINHPNYVPVGSYVAEKDVFDYMFFQYTPEEAKVMDPQIRIYHQCVWEALEDAGIDPSNNKLPIGIYTGAADNIIWRAKCMLNPHADLDTFSQEHLSSHEYISSLISYKLGLDGPAMHLKTACSTSLVAIHVACRSLLTGDAKIALAGGIRIGSVPNQGYLYEDGMILSKDGVCRTFDLNANGTIGSEGGGVVVLKKLKDAIKDGDHIYGVIKSTAINNDGDRKIGYTAPSVDGQTECIRVAHKMAGLKPENIDFIEAHGTGTLLGDAIELKAIRSIFGEERNSLLQLSSIKANIGHMDAGAGVGGFIKAILSVYHRELPGSVHFEQPNVELNELEGKIEVAVGNSPYPKEKDDLIRGGVSAFGIGGTNAHCIVEEYIRTETNQPLDKVKPVVLFLSAKTPSSLKGYAQKLLHFIRANEGLSVYDIAYTLNLRKKDWAFRKTIVATDRDEAIQLLEDYIEIERPQKSKKHNNLVFMVSASPVYEGVGIELYNNIPFFKKEINRLMQLAEETIQFDLKSYWLKGEGNPEFQKQLCRYHHPLFFVINTAVVNYMEHIGIATSKRFGHSLGEYVVACKAGVFSEKDAIHLLNKRGELFDTIEKVPVLSVNASFEKINSLGFESVDVASSNSPTNCLTVIQAEDEEAFKKALDAEDIFHKSVDVGVPAHSRCLEPIKDAYKKVLAEIDLVQPQEEYLSLGDHTKVATADYWVDHLRNTVDLTNTIRTLLNEEKVTFIEIGAGQPLTTFVKEHPFRKNKPQTFGTVRHKMEKRGELSFLFDQLGKIWAAGLTLNLKTYFKNFGKQIPIPTYAWDKHKFSAIAAIDFSGVRVITQDNDIQLMDNQFLVEFESQNKMQAPETDEELLLCDIFSGVFGYQINNVNTDFFELGGDSLKAMICIKKAKKEFNFDLKIVDFFDGKTVKEIAAKGAYPLVLEAKEIEFIEDAAPAGLHPLSYSQKNHFSALRFIDENIVLNQHVESVDFDMLKQAILNMCERHEILRINYVQHEKQWYQKIVPMDEFDFPMDIVKIREKAQESMDVAMQDEYDTPFADDAKSLIRVRILRYNRKDSYLILTVQHSIADGASINFIRQEIFENYSKLAGGDSALKTPLKQTYFHYIHEQLNYLAGEKGIKSKNYWTDKLSNSSQGLITENELKVIKIDETIDTLSSRFHIDKRRLYRLENYAREIGVTKSVFIQTAISIYLASQFNKEGVSLYTTNSGRFSSGMENIDVENAIGFFVNLIPHYFALKKDFTTKDMLISNSETFNNDLEHIGYPFEALADDLGWRDDSNLLRKSAVFNYHNYNKETHIEYDKELVIGKLPGDLPFLINTICTEYKNVIFVDFGVHHSYTGKLTAEEINNGFKFVLDKILDKENTEIIEDITSEIVNKLIRI